MNGLLALVIIFAVFAIGDLISYYSKSIISMLFTASVIFIVLFWLGVPATLFEDAQLKGIGALLIGLLITHMGTMLSLDDFVKQWRTVLVAVIAILGIGIFLYFIGPLFVERIYAIAAAPPIAGGVVAALVMGDTAKEMGMEGVQIFATLLVAVQGFVGYPLCSFILNKEARRVLAEGGKKEEKVLVAEKKPLIPPLKEDLQTTSVLLLKLSLCAFVSQYLSKLTNGVVHMYVIALFIGVLGRATGFLEPNIMSKANSFGFAMTALYTVIFDPLSKATPEVLGTLLQPIIVTLLIGSLGIIIFSTIAAKLLKMSVPMSIAIGTTALFGFPGTFILSNEVANANGKTPEERKLILDEILPKMLVAGFATVTVGSVIMAGIMVGMM